MNLKKNIKFFVIFFALAVFLSGGAGVAEAALPGSTPVGPYIPTAAETGLSDRGIKEVLTGILRWLLGVIGTIALISFTISGLMYLFASSDEKMAEKGKAGLTYSIIGIAIALAGYIIIKTIDFALRGTL